MTNSLRNFPKFTLEAKLIENGKYNPMWKNFKFLITFIENKLKIFHLSISFFLWVTFDYNIKKKEKLKLKVLLLIFIIRKK